MQKRRVSVLATGSGRVSVTVSIADVGVRVWGHDSKACGEPGPVSIIRASLRFCRGPFVIGDAFVLYHTRPRQGLNEVNDELESLRPEICDASADSIRTMLLGY